jgi:hypothetical protein
MWLFSGVIILFIIIFPNVFAALMDKIGIVSPANGLFAICVFLLLIMLLILTSIISRMNMKIKTMLQNIAILEKKIRELENRENR